MRVKMETAKRVLKDLAAGTAVTAVWALTMAAIIWPLVKLVNLLME